MGTEPLAEADRALAQGDYVRAVELLEQASPTDPAIHDALRDTLDHLKVLAAREMAAGRWTAAEDLFGVVREHEHRLTTKQRQEIDLFMGEIRRLRERERTDTFIRAATKMAASGLLVEARHVAVAAMETCDDPHLMARLRHFLAGMKHPDGKLLFGFDSALEVRAFCKPESGARVQIHQDPLSSREGAAAEITLPGPPSKLGLLDVPSDWSPCSELNFWICLLSKPPGEIVLSAGDGANWFRLPCDIGEGRWKQLRAPLEAFNSEGSPDWSRVSRLMIGTVHPVRFLIDEMRLKAR